MLGFASKKKKSNPKDSASTQLIAPQPPARASVSSNRQNSGSDIEDLMATRPSTYSHPANDLTMAIQGASQAMGNATVEGSGGESERRRKMARYPADPSDGNKGRPPQTGTGNLSTGSVPDDRRTMSQLSANTSEDQSGGLTTTRPGSHEVSSSREITGAKMSGDMTQGWVSNPGDEKDLRRQAGNDDRLAPGGGNKHDDRNQFPTAIKPREEDESLGLHSNGNTSQAYIPEPTSGGGGWSNIIKWPGNDESSKLLKTPKDKATRALHQTIEDKTARIKEMKEEHRKELNEKDAELNTLKKTSKKEKEERDEEIKKIKTWLSNLNAERARLEEQIGTARTNWQHWEQQHDQLKRQFEVYRGKAEAREKLAKDKLELVEKDNALLREVINQKSRPQEPIYPEDHYIMALDDLNTAVRQFVAKHSKINSKETLNPATQTRVINELAQYGKYGALSVEVLKPPRLLKLYTSSRFRIPLLRHIFTLFLFDRVLDRFAYPINTEISDYLKGIEVHLFHQGHDYNRVLLIRQAIARGVLAQTPGELVAQHRAKVIETFPDFLHMLLPKSRPADIIDGVTKIMDKALTLKKAMTEEQGVYRCFMIRSGNPQYSPLEVDIGEDRDVGGTLLMCTSPGLKRYIVNDEMDMEITIVVKATGELDVAEKGGK